MSSLLFPLIGCARFLSVFWNEKAEQEWSELLEYQIRKKRSFQKWTEDWPQFFSSRSVGEFRFAANALLFWSAIFVIAEWLQLILLILFNLPQIAEYKEWH